MSEKNIRISPVLGRWGNSRFMHYCPACDELHHFAVEQPFANGAQWTFNGNKEKPTFSPSMNIVIGPDPEDGRKEVCHYFLKDGHIQYLSDCTHDMAGKTIPLPPIPEKYFTDNED